MAPSNNMLVHFRASAEVVLEVFLRVVLFAVFWYLEDVVPFLRPLKREELWLYQNPVHQRDTVPTLLLMSMSLGLPSAFIITHYLSTGLIMDLRQGLLGLFLSTGLTAIITNLVKISVGRPRPDFFYRCFPDGHITSDLQCTGPFDAVIEGRKSFPSGHTAWIFSGFGFLSLYLLGKLHCLRASGHGEGWRLCLAISPLVAATLVGLSRYQDFRHHWDDILVGGTLGLVVACLCYHHYYPAAWSDTGHTPHAPSGYTTPAVVRVTTSPAELGASTADCEQGTPTNMSVGNTLANRRF